MGKLQSKHASKRRQSPEGGSLITNVPICQEELERIHIHRSKLPKDTELKENRSDHNSNLSVVLSPKKKQDPDNSTHFQANKQTKKKSYAGEPECNLVVEEDSRKEWVFTLYNFDNSGKVTKEDMSSLINSMYEVLETSVKQTYGGHTLKIKLAVTPTACSDKISQTVEKEQSVSQNTGNPVRKIYSVEENIERRNHYLDLAGIENYTSKFDNIVPPSQEPGQHTHSALQPHTVVARENYTSTPRDPSLLHSLKSSRGEGRSCRHSVSFCHPTKSHPAAHSVIQHSHSKRPHCRVQDIASHFRPTPGGDWEIFSNFQHLCSTPLVQKHDHRHHHEHHHHHHHHHHYHPS
ncbi:protein naked cuticle homolog 2 isoform X2 [Mastacembelus armatus]|uniref:protein naked cuticle homolog 2 isoform X2 n=1 Tax=Mastacembelus armatus TaxID=205130 RepID=UPI000E4597A1|nr:protein naked cuticle homolog 2-like isoform X2 [Mastacembelus armatus]